jgi:hypothetical protein
MEHRGSIRCGVVLDEAGVAALSIAVSSAVKPTRTCGSLSRLAAAQRTFCGRAPSSYSKMYRPRRKQVRRSTAGARISRSRAARYDRRGRADSYCSVAAFCRSIQSPGSRSSQRYGSAIDRPCSISTTSARRLSGTSLMAADGSHSSWRPEHDLPAGRRLATGDVALPRLHYRDDCLAQLISHDRQPWQRSDCSHRIDPIWPCRTYVLI